MAHMSSGDAAHKDLLSLPRIELRIEKRRKGVDDRGAEGVLAADQIFGEDAPGPLRVADALAAGKGVNRFRKLDAAIYHARGQRLGHQNAARLAESAARSVRHV